MAVRRYSAICVYILLCVRGWARPRPRPRPRGSHKTKAANKFQGGKFASSTGTALELLGLWSQPKWSVQPNGTICAPMLLSEFLRLQALFSEVMAFLASEGIRWLLSHGSLLGAWLHQTAVPWDEEGDIVILPDDFVRLRSLLGPPDTANVRWAPHGRMWVYEGPRLGALQYDYHEHSDESGGWLATAVTFRLAADPRDSPVHVDAFLARTNGSHAWTDSAVLPLQVLVPPRYIRFFDWLLPAPHDPLAALHLWYGPQFATRRKCALRPPRGSGEEESVASTIEQIAEVPGAAVARSYPIARNEWLDGGVLRSTIHHNGTIVWAQDVDAVKGRVIGVTGASVKRSPQLVHVTGEWQASGLDDAAASALVQTASASDFVHKGPFPDNVPNMWD